MMNGKPIKGKTPLIVLLREISGWRVEFFYMSSRNMFINFSHETCNVNEVMSIQKPILLHKVTGGLRGIK